MPNMAPATTAPAGPPAGGRLGAQPTPAVGIQLLHHSVSSCGTGRGAPVMVGNTGGKLYLMKGIEQTYLLTPSSNDNLAAGREAVPRRTLMAQLWYRVLEG